MTADYEIKAHPKFLEDIERLDKESLYQIYRAIERLKKDPLRFKHLRGTDFYRIRLGKYRLIYSVHEKEVRLLIFGKRNRVYREMKKRA